MFRALFVCAGAFTHDVKLATDTDSVVSNWLRSRWVIGVDSHDSPRIRGLAKKTICGTELVGTSSRSNEASFSGYKVTAFNGEIGRSLFGFHLTAIPEDLDVSQVSFSADPSSAFVRKEEAVTSGSRRGAAFVYGLSAYLGAPTYISAGLRRHIYEPLVEDLLRLWFQKSGALTLVSQLNKLLSLAWLISVETMVPQGPDYADPNIHLVPGQLVRSQDMHTFSLLVDVEGDFRLGVLSLNGGFLAFRLPNDGEAETLSTDLLRDWESSTDVLKSVGCLDFDGDTNTKTPSMTTFDEENLILRLSYDIGNNICVIGYRLVKMDQGVAIEAFLQLPRNKEIDKFRGQAAIWSENYIDEKIATSTFSVATRSPTFVLPADVELDLTTIWNNGSPVSEAFHLTFPPLSHAISNDVVVEKTIVINELDRFVIFDSESSDGLRIQISPTRGKDLISMWTELVKDARGDSVGSEQVGDWMEVLAEAMTAERKELARLVRDAEVSILDNNLTVSAAHFIDALGLKSSGNALVFDV